MGKVKILIGGDFAPVGKNLPFLRAGNSSRIFGETIELFVRSTFSIVNLECPLIHKKSPILKAGPHLEAPVEVLDSLGFINAFNLANNHILDHGPRGLESTINACRERGNLTVGAGENIKQAAKPLLFGDQGLRVGIISMAEHEFSVCSPSEWGANPLDIRHFVRTVQENMHKWDFLIVLVHGGIEHYPFPTPELKNNCRFMVEQGANVVICQHSHCPGSWERYQNNYIIYGQGNLLFDKKGITEGAWTEGFLVGIDVPYDGGEVEMTLYPFKQSGEDIGIKLLCGEEADCFMQVINERSSKISDDEFLAKEFEKFVSLHCDRYLSVLYRKGVWWRRFYRRFGSMRKMGDNSQDLALLNMLRTESLREAGVKVLNLL